MFQIKSEFTKLKAVKDSLLFNIKKDDIFYACEVLVKIDINYDLQYFLFNNSIIDKLENKTHDPYFCLFDKSFIKYVFEKIDISIESKVYQPLLDLKILIND